MKRYDKYKNSGVEWLCEIPEHWELSRLGTLLKPISTNNRTDLPLLSITREKGVILRDLDNEEENHNFIPDDLSNYKMIRKGQFGMNKMKAWQGSYGISDYDGIVSPAYFIFDLDSKIEPRYFHASIRSKLYISFYGSASDGVRIGQWDLSKPRMKQIPFLIPPKAEQTAIANFLDDKTTKIEQAIAIKQKQIELLKERRQILIHKAVTRGLNDKVKLKDSGVEWIGEIPEHWNAEKFKFYIKLRHGNQFREDDFTEEGIKVVKISQLHPDGYIDLSKASTISSNRLKSFEHIIIKENDVLMCLTGGTIGKIIRAKNIHEPLLQNYRVGHFSSLNKNHLNEDYMFLLLSSKLIMNQILVDMSETGQPNIGMEDMENMYLVIPNTIEEQQQIVDFIENATTKISTAISLKEQEIEKLKEYKMSLIDGVVTGKVKVC